MFLINIAVALIVGTFYVVSKVPQPETTADFDAHIRLSIFFLIALIVPFVEETIFRSWLGQRLGILVALPVLLLFGLIYLADLTGGPRWILLSLALIVSGVYAQHMWRSRHETVRHENLIRKIFPIVFWLTALSFALLHLFNFSAGDIGVLAVLQVMPQAVCGLILGYTRMRFGFLSCFGLHACFNGVLLLLATLAQMAVAGG